MPQKQKRLRKEHGSVIALVLCMFLFVAFAGFFAFDANRAQMAERELVAACDSASITGTSMLASFDTSPGNVTLGDAQNWAGQYAFNMFQNASLLGNPLNNANLVLDTTSLNNVTAGQCNVMIAVADPTSNYAIVPPWPASNAGKAIIVYATYGYQPSFLGGIGVGMYPLRVGSKSGIPQVDAVLVFDYSGSMDDFTTVSMVRRQWDQTNNCPKYIVVNGNNPGPTHMLSDYLRWNWGAPPGGSPEGNKLNVLPPQNLESTETSGGQAPTIASNQFTWDACLRANPLFSMGAAAAITHNGRPINSNDYGNPPGDWPVPFQAPVPPNSPSGTQPTWYSDYQIYQNYLTSLGPWNSSGNPAAPPDKGSLVQVAFQAMVLPYDTLPTHDHGSDYTQPGTYLSPQSFNTCAYTDLVVNVTDPGSYQQPIAMNDHFSGFTWTPGAQEPDTRLQGQSFAFPNIAAVVEAARGNLDNQNNYLGAILNGKVTIVDDYGSTTTAANLMPQPQAYYQLAYERLAMLEAQPYATACDGAENGFFYKLNELSDVRFGLVGFSGVDDGDNLSGIQPYPAFNLDSGGTSAVRSGIRSFYDDVSGWYTWSPFPQIWSSNTNPNTAQPNKYWWRPYPNPTSPTYTWNPEINNMPVSGGMAGATGFRVPRMPLNQNSSNICAVTSHVISGTWPYNVGTTGSIWSAMSNDSNANGLWNGRPMGQTYCDEALKTAMEMFNSGTYGNNCRPAARKTIVFFTDGEPTNGITGSVATNANSVATLAKQQNISIFTVGLNVSGNTDIQADQLSFLGDGTKGNGDKGLAYIAGNGGRYYPCGTGQDVRNAFISIARRLSQNQ